MLCRYTMNSVTEEELNEMETDLEVYGSTFACIKMM